MNVNFYQCDNLPTNEETGLIQMCEICFNKFRYDDARKVEFFGPGEPEATCDFCDTKNVVDNQENN